ncbi:hypothetical protein AC1031_019571 [Aphanomyces cochlioides]|nr:hypothetical protein AC1031_019571 [Aphanomyces cochlioides]
MASVEEGRRQARAVRKPLRLLQMVFLALIIFWVLFSYWYMSSRVEPLLTKSTRAAKRGFVIPMFDAMLPIGISLIQELRRYGNTDLIQVYHCLGELSPLSLQLLHRADNYIEVVDVCHEYVESGKLTLEQAKDFRNFYIKPLALIHTRLDQPILLDADDIFFMDPAALWDVPEYKSIGTIFFYDREINENSYLNGKHKLTLPSGVEIEENTLQEMVRIFEYSRFDLERNPSKHVLESLPYNSQGAHEQDSSIVVVDKRKHPLAMDVLWFLITKWRYRYTYSWGDKENFWLAYELSQSPYNFSPHGTSAAGGRQGHDPNTVCGDIAHFFPESGRADILHINGNRLINPYTKTDAVNAYDHSFNADKKQELTNNIPGYFAGLRPRGPTPIMQPNGSCPQECMYQRGYVAMTSAQRRSMEQRIADTFAVAEAVQRHVAADEGVIIWLVGLEDVNLAITAVKELRTVGYKGWIHAYHCLGNFPSDILQGLHLSDSKVHVVDGCNDLVITGKITTAQVKDLRSNMIASLALVHTKLKRVVLLDIHSVVLEDPTSLWSKPAFISTGTYFFHAHANSGQAFLNQPTTFKVSGSDASRQGTALEALIATFNYTKFDFGGPSPSHSLQESKAWKKESAVRQDASLVAIDKSKLASTVVIDVLLELITVDQPRLKFSNGAAETYWLAFELSQLPYSFAPYAPTYVGNPRRAASGTTLVSYPAQFGEAGSLLTVSFDPVPSRDSIPDRICLREHAEHSVGQDNAKCLVSVGGYEYLSAFQQGFLSRRVANLNFAAP